MNVLKTLQYMKPDIKVLVWENDINKIVYNEHETFRPTKEEILAVDQSLVAAAIETKPKQIEYNELVLKVEELTKKIDDMNKAK